MDDVVGAAFNLGLASAISVAETCDNKDEILFHLHRWLDERREELSKEIPVTRISTTPKPIEVKK